MKIIWRKTYSKHLRSIFEPRLFEEKIIRSEIIWRDTIFSQKIFEKGAVSCDLEWHSHLVVKKKGKWRKKVPLIQLKIEQQVAYG